MRSTTLTPGSGPPVAVNLDLVRDEPHMINVTGYESGPVILTIATSEGAAPIVEIPATGAIIIRPETVQVLTEGLGYFYNLWTREDGDLRLLVKGRITLGNSIRPMGADLATTLFENGQGFITCTAAQYAALAVRDPNTLYVVR